MKCAAVFLLCAQAVALAPAKRSNSSVIAVEANTTAQNSSSQIDDAMNAVATMMGKMNDQPKKHHALANVSTSSHQKVDVGFTGFEKEINQTLESGIQNATKDVQWTSAMRQELTTNITDTMNFAIKDKLKPIKQDIGKTWMALPDDQKDEYVSQLKARFASDWEGAMPGITSHLKIGLRRVEEFSQQTIKLAPDKLLSNSKKTLADSLVNPRCYGSDDTSFLELDLVAPTSAPAAEGKGKSHKLKKFCMPPAFQALVGRMNDTEGLLSMSMRFESGAMSLVQTGSK